MKMSLEEAISPELKTKCYSPDLPFEKMATAFANELMADEMSLYAGPSYQAGIRAAFKNTARRTPA